MSLAGPRRTGSLLTLAARAAIKAVPGVGRRVSGTALTSIAILLVNLGSGVAQARGLGPEGRGQLTVAMLWPTLFGSIGALGIREAVTFHTARGDSSRSPVLATALTIGAGQTLVLAVVALLLLPIILHGSPSSVLHETVFYLWILPLYPLTLYPQAFFQGRMEMGAFNICRFSDDAASTAPLLLLWLLNLMTVRASLWASLAATAFSAALCFAILIRRREVTWRPSISLVRPIMSFGIRLHVGNVITLISQRLDLIILSLVVGTANLGIYAVATSAGAVASLLPTATSLVLLPAFAGQDAAARPAALARLFLVGGAFTVLAAPLLGAVLPLAIPILFGSAFTRAVSLTALLALGYLMRGWNLILCSVIQGAGRPFSTSLGRAVEFVVLGALLLLLVPRFGTMGAAVSVVIGAVASSGVLVVAAFEATRLRPAKMWRFWALEVRRWRQASATWRAGATENTNR